MGKQYKAAIYCRVAHPDDFAIESQRRRLVQYAEENGYTGLACYLDNGQSGLSFDRPAFSQMETDIQAGKIRAVIVKDAYVKLRINYNGSNFANILRTTFGQEKSTASC